MKQMNNPLLVEHNLPPFKEINAEHVVPAVDTLIKQNLDEIENIVERAQPPTWENLVWPIEELEDKLNKAWSPVSHLNSVVNTPALREAHHECISKLSDYATKIGQNERLYLAYQALAQSPVFLELTQAQQKVVTNALRDFKLSGVVLSKEKREEFARLSQTLATLQNQFQDNVMDETDNWYLDITTREELKGIPEQSLSLAQEAAKKANVTGWRLTLDFPCFQAVITYADNAQLRQKMHKAYFTRASNLGSHPEKWDNSALMEKILATRHQMANLLGFNNYAEYSLATKMVKKPEEVMKFLADLAVKTKPFAQRDFQQLQEFAKKEYGVEQIEPWDISYYSEKLRQKRFSLSQETLRPYFPVPRVVEGMFTVVKRLYGLEFVESKEIQTWHDDVRFFEIYDSNKVLRGSFYLDLYARNQKRGGAWMDEARVRRRLLNNQLQLPVAYLTCNFRTPVGSEPSLLTHDEVVTLFHEFGHGLHHMLSQIDAAEVSGINGVPWDVVELPSQFMENWCWQNAALEFISGHYQSSEPLPTDLLEKMQQAKNFQAGMMLLRQLEFSLFDFRIHLEYDPLKGGRVQEILDEIRKQYSVVPVADYSRFQHSFSHIFAGGYAAGYYSYLWAEVLACDAFSKFEEEGIFNAQTGKDFMQKILEKGGSVDPELLFKDFRGRPPEMSAFLRQHGLE